MRSTIEINEKLLKEAMRLTNARTKKEVVNLSLECLVKNYHRKSLKDKFGKVDLGISLEDLETWRDME
jgi:Arc/MetJ family transcription regulator